MKKLLTNHGNGSMMGERLAKANYYFAGGLAKSNPSAVYSKSGEIMNLTTAQEGKEYIIQRIETDDEELNAFLFSLGCYSGEPITVVSRRRGSCVVSIKDGRYNIDEQLAEAIVV